MLSRNVRRALVLAAAALGLAACNTNKLVYWYPDCTGLKTGSTSKAKFCISATAQRDGLSLICVIMAAQTRDERNAAAAKLLDYGFARFSSYHGEAGEQPVRVEGGVLPECHVCYDGFDALIPKGQSGNVEKVIELPEFLSAPLSAGDEVGRVIYKLNGEEIGSVPIRVKEPIERIGFGTLFSRLLSRFLLM